MFTNRLFFYVISEEKTLEEVIRALDIPEDTEVDIRTVSGLEEITADCNHSDVAVIMDGRVLTAEQAKALDAGRMIALLTLEDMSPTERENLLAYVDELWVSPSENRYDRGLLEFHFSNLLKDMKVRADARREHVCFQTFLDGLPDMAWFKNVDGAHLIVNDAFCGIVGKTKEQTYKKDHCFIWNVPDEEREQRDYMCRESEEITIREGHTCQFEEPVKTRGGMRQFQTYKSPLVDTDGSIFGTCGIGHDITELKNKDNEIEVVLESLPFGVVLEDNNRRLMEANSRFKNCFSDVSGMDDKTFD